MELRSPTVEKLGKEWYSDSLTISDMKDGKTAAEKLQGYWLLELGELAGIKKVDVETVKSFVWVSKFVMEIEGYGRVSLALNDSLAKTI